MLWIIKLDTLISMLNFVLQTCKKEFFFKSLTHVSIRNKYLFNSLSSGFVLAMTQLFK